MRSHQIHCDTSSNTPDEAGLGGRGASGVPFGGLSAAQGRLGALQAALANRPTSASRGAAGSSEARLQGVLTQLGRSFGEDLTDVRVHRGVPGALASRGVRAVAEDDEVALDPGSLDDIDGAGREILAHELAHVVQRRRGTVAPDAVDQELGGGSASGPRERDALEEDADRAAARATRGEAAPIAAGAEAPEQQFSLWDSVRSAGNWVSNAASGAYNTANGALNTASGYVHRAEQGITSGVHRAEDWVSHGAHALADRVGGPAAHLVADAVGVSGQALGGVVGGASTMIGGITNAALHPVDTVMGIEAMLEHSGTPAGTVLRAGHDLVNVARGHQTLSQTARRAVDPTATATEDAGFWTQVGAHIAAPYRASAQEHRYGEMVGRGIFDIGSLLWGGGEVSAARRGAAAAGDFGRVGEGTRAAGVASDAIRAERAAGGSGRAAGTSTEAATASAGGGGRGSPPYRAPQTPPQTPAGPHIPGAIDLPDEWVDQARASSRPTLQEVPHTDPLNPLRPR